MLYVDDGVGGRGTGVPDSITSTKWRLFIASVRGLAAAGKPNVSQVVREFYVSGRGTTVNHYVVPR